MTSKTTWDTSMTHLKTPTQRFQIVCCGPSPIDPAFDWTDWTNLRGPASCRTEWVVQNGFKMTSLKIASRALSDPPISEIDFKKRMALLWTTLKFVSRVMLVHLCWWQFYDFVPFFIILVTKCKKRSSISQICLQHKLPPQHSWPALL